METKSIPCRCCQFMHFFDGHACVGLKFQMGNHLSLIEITDITYKETQASAGRVADECGAIVETEGGDTQGNIDMRCLSLHSRGDYSQLVAGFDKLIVKGVGFVTRYGKTNQLTEGGILADELLSQATYRSSDRCRVHQYRTTDNLPRDAKATDVHRGVTVIQLDHTNRRPTKRMRTAASFCTVRGESRSSVSRVPKYPPLATAVTSKAVNR